MKRWIAFLFAAVMGVVSALMVAVNYEVLTVSDETMAPAYRKGDHILIDRMVFAETFGGGKSFDRGDVILFSNAMHTETGEGVFMMKRIVGLAGEWISIADGNVCIDGVVLDESAYLTGSLGEDSGLVDDMVKRFVDGGQYFVLGDNRLESTDSRSETVGMVEEEAIQGKVILQW